MKGPKQTELRSFVGDKRFENISWWFIEKIVKRPIIYTLFGFIVLLIGLVLSLVGFDSAFQRSGSVLVALVILTVYFCFLVSDEHTTKQSMLGTYGKMDTLEKVKKSLPNGMAEKAAVQLHTTLENSRNSMPELRNLINRLYFTEAIFGVFGTIVWGFGDLPFST